MQSKYFYVWLDSARKNMRDRPKGVRLIQLRSHDYSELRLATLEMESGHYLDFTALMALVSHQSRDRLWTIVRDNVSCFRPAKGSRSNHQAWEGGYLDHIAETMNIACQLYNTLSSLRKLPFTLGEALEVMFLHDIEKPFAEELKVAGRYTKAARKGFRADMIHKYEINLTPAQENALRYVEGVPDLEYTPGERLMGELASFCHCCDILSARLWHDKGEGVPAPAWE